MAAMMKITILTILLTLKGVHIQSNILQRDLADNDKQALLDELEKMLEEHKENTKSKGPSVSLEKLKLLKQKLDDVSALMDDIYNNATAMNEETVRPTESATVAPTVDMSVTYPDCSAAYSSGQHQSGVYMIQTGKAYCNMDIADGGWTVIQRRFDGSIDFYRSWSDYRSGFGDVSGEHWLGLEAIHQLTKRGNRELYILLEEFDGALSYARYGEFMVSSEAEKYELHVKKYTGNAGDGLRYHNRIAFSTKDRDNDESTDVNCSVDRGGAWWYGKCMMSNLNGRYRSAAETGDRYGFSWYKLKGSYHYFLKGSTMMIK